MPKYPANQGLIHTAALYGGGQRWQIVSPYIATTSLVPATDAKQLCDSWESSTLPLYRALLAEDCEIIGQQCEEMVSGNAIPYRVNYALGTFPGLVSGRSYSQQVSMLTAWFSTLQVVDGPSTHTGKTFWGPPAESGCDQNSLTPGYFGDLISLSLNVLLGYTLSSGTVVRRALARKPVGTDDVYVVDVQEARSSVFTQRRRLTPIM